MRLLNYCSQQQFLVPRIAAQGRSAPGSPDGLGAAAPSAPHATIGVPRTISIVTKTRSPKSLVPWQCPTTERQRGLQITQPLWRRAPQHCPRDETSDLRQLCHQSHASPCSWGRERSHLTHPHPFPAATRHVPPTHLRPQQEAIWEKEIYFLPLGKLPEM